MLIKISLGSGPVFQRTVLLYDLFSEVLVSSLGSSRIAFGRIRSRYSFESIIHQYTSPMHTNGKILVGASHLPMDLNRKMILSLLVLCNPL